MARLWSSGFELNSTTSDMEWTSVTGTASINSTAAYLRSGGYSGRTNPSSSTGFFTKQITDGIDATINMRVRAYIYIASAPGGLVTIMEVTNGSSTDMTEIRLNSNRTLEFWGVNSTFQQHGSDSDALSLDTWHMVEVQHYYTGTVTAELDGVQFASGTSSGIGSCDRVHFGIRATETADLYWDDIAVNDGVGSFQNNFPGEGSIVHLYPNAAGDQSDFTPDSGSNYQMVDEKPTPDDITTKNRGTDNDFEDQYNLESMSDAGVEGVDTVTLTQVGSRLRTEDTSWTDVYLSIEYNSVVEYTIQTSLDSTAWTTFGWYSVVNDPTYLLTNYDLPGASTTAWSEAAIDATQIGLKQYEIFGDYLDVSSMWLLVEYIPELGLPAETTDSVTVTESVSTSLVHQVKKKLKRGVKII